MDEMCALPKGMVLVEYRPDGPRRLCDVFALRRSQSSGRTKMEVMDNFGRWIPLGDVHDPERGTVNPLGIDTEKSLRMSDEWGRLVESARGRAAD